MRLFFALSSQLHSPGRRSLIYWRMPRASSTPLGCWLGFALLSEPLVGLILGRLIALVNHF